MIGMMNLIKKHPMMLALIILSIGCSSSAKVLVPKLGLRTLRISRDFAGFEYRYCKKKKFLSSKCKEWHTDKYDLTDGSTRQKLIDMGFVAKVRRKP